MRNIDNRYLPIHDRQVSSTGIITIICDDGRELGDWLKKCQEKQRSRMGRGATARRGAMRAALSLQLLLLLLAVTVTFFAACSASATTAAAAASAVETRSATLDDTVTARVPVAPRKLGESNQKKVVEDHDSTQHRHHVGEGGGGGGERGRLLDVPISLRELQQQQQQHQQQGFVDHDGCSDEGRRGGGVLRRAAQEEQEQEQEQGGGFPHLEFASNRDLDSFPSVNDSSIMFLHVFKVCILCFSCFRSHIYILGRQCTPCGRSERTSRRLAGSPLGGKATYWIRKYS